MEVNMKRLEVQCKFSYDANLGLKNDYDSLQNKFDKHMKSLNNLIMDLREEINLYQAELGKLKLFKSEIEESLDEMKAKLKKEVKDELNYAKRDADRAREEVKLIESQLNDYK